MSHFTPEDAQARDAMAHSLRLIAALRSPSAYAHSVQAIELLETHISWVLLTGEFAYKIKKPVAMGFLDFTSLDRRRYFCEEEIRLNRRLAPQLYRGVVPITGTLESPQMDGSGEAIEWAVQMRQFPQDALLSHLLEHGALAASQIETLAEVIAEFHQRIAVASPESVFGTLEHVWNCVDQNFAKLALTPDDDKIVVSLRDWCAREFATRRPAFLARKQGGFIRECHGDMHLGNMLLLDGKPVIFDGIEFNDEFRWIDVASEIAFAVMDLQQRGRPDFAHRLLDDYLQRTGDYEALRVLHFYLVYRALVRATVASIRGHQSDVVSQEIAEEYRSYLDLAQHYAQPRRPRLIITHGPSGSGKTTVARALQAEIGGICLRSDIERKRLFGLKPLDRSTGDLAARIYSDEATEQTYGRLVQLARVVIDAGFDCVVDATFQRRQQRDMFRQLAHETATPLVILDLRVPQPTLQSRITSRLAKGDDASEAGFAVLDGQLRAWEPLDADEQVDARRVDVERPESLTEAITAIQQRA